MPLSVLEAMASGLPVVSFAVGDVPYMVAAENSTFASIALDDEEGFRGALATLAQSPSLRAQLGQANQALAFQKFDLTQMLRDYAALLG
jgi:L-malate glycosyltransferase